MTEMAYMALREGKIHQTLAEEELSVREIANFQTPTRDLFQVAEILSMIVVAFILYRYLLEHLSQKVEIIVGYIDSTNCGLT